MGKKALEELVFHDDFMFAAEGSWYTIPLDTEGSPS